MWKIIVCKNLYALGQVILSVVASVATMRAIFAFENRLNPIRIR